MSAETPSTEIVCKNCQHRFTGRYCSNCGEKVMKESDKSAGHFFEENFHFITHFEGSFFNTLRTIFKAPGKLSLDYTSGTRKRYFKPVSFFLLLVVLYLLFPLFSGLNMPLRGHLKGQAYEKLAKQIARPKFDRYLAQYSDSTVAFNELSEVYSRKSEKTSKLLLFVIIPLCSLPLLLFYRRRPYWYDHLVLSTEINSFFMVFVFFIMAGLANLVALFSPGLFNGDNAVAADNAMSTISYLVLFIFCKKAVERFYQIGPIVSVPFTLLFLFCHYLVVYIVYKFLLFVTVMALI